MNKVHFLIKIDSTKNNSVIFTSAIKTYSRRIEKDFIFFNT